MEDSDVMEMVQAALRRAAQRRPRTVSELRQYVKQEMALELAEAWGQRRGYC